MTWEHKDTWRQRAPTFLVEISRHNGGEYCETGPHRWCVYAYIYPTHPRFKRFDGTANYWQQAVDELPLHGGPTYMITHLGYDGAADKVTSYQVGCDYSHLGDERFTHMATLDDARSVQADADRLFAFLAAEELDAKAKSREGGSREVQELRRTDRGRRRHRILRSHGGEDARL